MQRCTRQHYNKEHTETNITAYSELWACIIEQITQKKKKKKNRKTDPLRKTETLDIQEE